jgi:ABC-type branched-subunit amino acid transport system permease subunit
MLAALLGPLASTLRLGGVNMWTIVLVSATILGAFGGFPKPPKVFTNLTQYSLVQWLLVFVLAYQGGSGQNVGLALMATLLTFVLYQVLKYFESDDEEHDMVEEDEDDDSMEVEGAGGDWY